MKTSVKILLLITIQTIGSNLLAQKLRFEHLTENEGLPQSNITQLMQDKQGFLWIGTVDGLYRYDGNEFREFRHQRGDSTSLSHNVINSIIQDSKGNIWIGTRSGLSCYLSEKEIFIQYLNFGIPPFDQSNYIHTVMEDKFGKLWFGTYNGTFRMDVDKKEFIRFAPEKEKPNSILHELAYKIFEDQKGRLWFGMYNGVSVYENDGSFNFKNYIPTAPQANNLKASRIFNFAEQPDGALWLGGYIGVYKVIEKNGDFDFKWLGYDPKSAQSLSYDFVETLVADGNNRLWVGTWNGGLNEILMDAAKENFQYLHHRNELDNPLSLSHDLVQSVLRDRSNILWVGTAAGLDRIAPSATKFSIIQNTPASPKSLSNNHVQTIFKDSKGNFWFGTRGGGLNRISSQKLDNHNFTFDIFKNDPSNPRSLSHDDIYGLYEDSQHYLWIATYDGLNFIHLPSFDKNPVFQSFNTADGLTHKFIFSILEIEKNVYWLSTYGQHAKMFFKPENPKKTRFQMYDMDVTKEDALVNATTYTTIADRFGDYWIGTFYGLSKYIQKDGREYFENFQNVLGDPSSLSGNFISCLFLDSKGRMWAGTEGGLNYFIQIARNERVRFRGFDISDGLPNDVIHSIEEDARGFLWLSTNKGLLVFDPQAAISGKPPVVKTYTFEDGLQGNEFNDRASFKDENGLFFFAGANGVNYFKPSEIIENQDVPSVVFTDLKLFNKAVVPSNDKNAILKKAINFTHKIVLNHSQNDISIEFAALDFTQPGKNKYKYQLEGFNENWVFNGENNTATYTNLKAGTYIFKAKGSNNDGVWSSKPAELIIEVLPPPWKTWWAYLIYFSGFVGLVYAYNRYRIQLKIKELENKAAIERARFNERETLRKKNAADFHDELGHRLTKISLFLELAERQLEKPSPMSQYLSKIKQNATELSLGIRDLIWTLDPKKDTLFQTMVRMQEFGDKLFEYSTIHFQTSGNSPDFERIELSPDVRKQLLMIFKEAMNNCLKYSEAKTAKLTLHKEKGSLEISFQDDGKGFRENGIEYGYGLKNMQERAQKMAANLQISSQPQKGTQIKISKIPHVG